MFYHHVLMFTLQNKLHIHMNKLLMKHWLFDQLFIISIITVVKCQQGHSHQLPVDEHHNLKITLEVLVIGEL
jgi:hypothetical protein